ncbi:MAG: hypothetical protein WCK65_03315 [Rhodospirillaceae bacterium]
MNEKKNTKNIPAQDTPAAVSMAPDHQSAYQIVKAINRPKENGGLS